MNFIAIQFAPVSEWQWQAWVLIALAVWTCAGFGWATWPETRGIKWERSKLRVVFGGPIVWLIAWLYRIYKL